MAHMSSFIHRQSCAARLCEYCIRMYARMQTHVYRHISTCTGAHTCVPIYLFTNMILVLICKIHTAAHVHIYTYTFVCVHVYVCAHTYMYLCIYACVYAFLLILLYEYMHVYVYIYIYVCIWFCALRSEPPLPGVSHPPARPPRAGGRGWLCNFFLVLLECACNSIILLL